MMDKIVKYAIGASMALVVWLLLYGSQLWYLGFLPIATLCLYIGIIAIKEIFKMLK